MHLWVFLSNLAALHARPDHEGVHGPLHVVLFAPVFLLLRGAAGGTTRGGGVGGGRRGHGGHQGRLTQHMWVAGCQGLKVGRKMFWVQLDKKKIFLGSLAKKKMFWVI